MMLPQNDQLEIYHIADGTLEVAVTFDADTVQKLIISILNRNKLGPAMLKT